MKTKQLFFLGILGLSSLFIKAQTTIQTTSLTSYGVTSGTLGTGNAFYGANSGKVITATGVSNSFFGQSSGIGVTTGDNNCFFGAGTGTAGGVLTTTGSGNCYVGTNAGPYANGSDNVCVGAGAMNYNTVAIIKTTAIGTQAGAYTSGNENLFLGYMAGAYKNGSNNVFIGNNVGESSSNKLHIDNAATATPLIWGDFALDQVKLNGKVGIGFGTTISFPTASAYTNYKLFVTGGILTDEVRVKLPTGGTWADYVFNDDYKLLPLSEVENHIKANGHLPNVPSGKEIAETGIDLGDMAKIQQEKIEELTLYLIQQNKEIEKLKAQMKLLAKE